MGIPQPGTGARRFRPETRGPQRPGSAAARRSNRWPRSNIPSPATASLWRRIGSRAARRPGFRQHKGRWLGRSRLNAVGVHQRPQANPAAAGNAPNKCGGATPSLKRPAPDPKPTITNGSSPPSSPWPISPSPRPRVWPSQPRTPCAWASELLCRPSRLESLPISLWWRPQSWQSRRHSSFVACEPWLRVEQDHQELNQFLLQGLGSSPGCWLPYGVVAVLCLS